MATVNEQLADEAISHSIDLTRYSNSVIRRIIALLNKTDRDLANQITAALERLPAESFTVERLDALLQSVRQTNAVAYQQVSQLIETELKDLVQYEAAYQYQLFQSTLPVQVSVAAVNVGQVYAASLSRPFQGTLLKECLAGLEANKARMVRDAIRIGYVEGQTIQQITQRIMGTRALQYTDGLMETSRRDAAAMVRTAVSHTANFTRNEFYKQNNDLVKGIKWISTLDGRTSAVCRARDGEVYPIDSGPRPPAHWNCRSSTTPVIRSWKELGIDLPESAKSTRASMDGQVPEDMTYQDWLRKQPVERQDDILGKAKGQLFRKGGLTLDRFIDRNGRELNLAELRAKNAAAFAKAGL